MKIKGQEITQKDIDRLEIKSILKTDRKGSKSSRASFTDNQVREIRVRLKNMEKIQKIADFYHVDQSTIRKIAKNISYQNVV